MVNQTILGPTLLFILLYLLSINEYPNPELRVRRELVICILSARSNFEQRNTLRATWVGHVKRFLTRDVRVYFVVGKRCDIPPEDRSTPYECVPSNKKYVGFKRNHEIQTCQEVAGILPNLLNNSAHVYPGFSFRLHHPVLIKKLGVLKSLLQENLEKWANVVLENPLSGDTLYSVNISLSSFDVEEKGFLYKSVPPLSLPKDFEGQVYLNDGVKTVVDGVSTINWETAGDSIRFTQLLADVSFVSIETFSKKSVPGVSISFSVYEPQELLEHTESSKKRQVAWDKENGETAVRLNEEDDLYRDMVFVNCTDVYRNLPLKLLEFFQWLKAKKVHYNYVLKVDDDTVVDVSRIVQLLRSNSSRFDSPKKIWIGQFRKNWMVYHHGKWAELDYPSSVYPAFSCGGAYVVSRGIVAWLANNIRHVRPFQGEDVSMGIWLAPLKPLYVDEKRLECAEQCDANSISRSQLNTEGIIEAWHVFYNCSNICTCNALPVV